MNKEVKITLTIDGVEQEVKSINDLQKAVKNLGTETKETKEETSFFKKQLDNIKDSFGGLIEDAKGLKSDFTGWANSIKTTQGVVGKLKIALSALGLPLLLSLIATGIEYFKNFEGGVKLISTAMNVLNAVVGQLTDSFVKLFSGDLSGFADSFLGIADAAGEAVKNTNKQFEAQSKLAELTKKNTVENAKLTQQLEFATKVLEDETATYEQRVQALKDVEAAEIKLIQNKKLETELILQNLKAQLALENNYERRRDLAQQIAEAEASVIEKQTELTVKSGEANKKIREINIQRAKEAEDRAKKQAEIDQQFLDLQVKNAQEATLMEIENDREREAKRLEFEKSNEEEALKRSEFNATQRAALLLQIDEKYLLKNKELKDKFAEEDAAKQKAKDEKDAADKAAADQKAAEEAKTRQDAANALLEELRLGSIEDAFDRAQAEIDIQYQKDRQILLDAKATDEQLAVLDKAYVDGSKALAKEEASFKREQAAGLADGIANLVGESSRVGKIASIASATINTFEGATKAIAQGGFFGIATAAITIAAGLKNIQKIIQTKVPGEGGGISTPASLSGSASTPSFDPTAALDEAARNSTMTNRIGTVNMGAEPVKAYVVSGEMTSAQEKEQKIENLSRL